MRALLLGFISVVLVLGNLLAGCSGQTSSQPEEIIIYAAASLTDPFEEIKEVYEQSHPDVDIVYSFAGSQVLSNQIEAGAQVSMFFSANKEYIAHQVAKQINPLSQEDIVLTPVPFATNQVVILCSEALPCNTFDGLMEIIQEDLYYPIVLGNPKVPVGRYTEKVMMAYGRQEGKQDSHKAFYNQVVSYESDVKAVLAKVKLKEADIGVVYESDVMTLDLEASGLKVIKIPAKLNPTASYESLLFSNKETSIKLYEFITSGEGQTILENYGFR